ncbi:MAG TPA: chromosome segregation protein SMC [Phycisphaerae bacterium]|nr:chromosome segregation protein SMC [Phycisphaerae bacterium]HRY68746.1 chromosome segregation protein SMC [Phycisphaerae bacterium]
MFLKRLTCQGFKSFADKIDFDFLPGITGIVGPNGCGKSNVVDAIKWALGDQSAKSLRGEQMQDVIFFGSGTRKSASMAQVDLVFGNEDRKLPVDSDEVKITRRLYRTGESEYLINNEPARLKDIKELFLDTGIGVTAYSIIEQGKVSYLIQANPAQRRVVFEEAAGISRYKARKKEAERKLERAEQNLLRLEDIVDEVEKQLRSVKYQAGKARNYQVYDQQLREKRAMYALADYHRLNEQAAGLKSQVETVGDEVTRLRTAITEAETREAGLRTELDRLDGDRHQIHQQVLSNTAEITEKRERIGQTLQQLDMLGGVRSREQERLAGERQKTIRLQQSIEAVEAEVADVDDRLREVHRIEDELAGQDGQLGRDLAGLEQACEEEKALIIEVVRRTTQLNNEVQSLDREKQKLEAEQQRLQARQGELQAELAELTGYQSQLDERGRELAATIAEHGRQLDEQQQEAARLDADQSELNQQLAAAKEHRSGMVSRKQTLLDLDRKLEGVDSGVRELLHRKEQDTTGRAFAYVWGMVADLIAADVANAALIETALGEYDQYLVVEQSRLMLADAGMLADFPGRVPAICLDLLPPFIDGRDFTQQEGFVNYAINLVRYPQEAEPLVRHLLGRTIIVRTMADALQLARQNPPMYRYVTLTGELLDPQGICQLGPAGARAGLISRKSELREIDAQIQEVDDRIEAMAERLDHASAEAARLQQAQQALRNARYEARAAEAENNAARSANQNAIDRLSRMQPQVAGDIASAELQIRETVRRASASRESLAHLEGTSEEHHRRVQESQAQIVLVRQQRAQLAERVTATKVEAGRMSQQRGMLSDRLRGLRESRHQSEEAVRTAAAAAQQAAQRLTLAERTILAAQSRLADLYADKERLDRAILDSGRHREQMAVEIETLGVRLKTDRGELEQSEQRLNAIQMDFREYTIRMEDLVNRVREELSLNLAEAHASYEHQDQDWAAVEAEIEALKEKIRRLGNVNLDAIAEQEKLEERSGFLTAQRDDLRHAKGQLETLIEQLNVECRERFTQTFEVVRGHFNDMFRKLFGGGRADLSYETPPEGQPLDVLEAGIEIHARPPGKEMRTNSLLSGGEKTMTAIALLMAVFRSRPSPFAILDEVDAALDEANNERFNRIIAEFLDTTQFLVITHQKATMSMADVLYGVTMQEAGVSKRVSVKFESPGEENNAAVA